MDFEDYYQKYLSLHQNKWNKMMHLLGNVITIFFIIFCIYNKHYFSILVSPFIIYIFAWTGHLYFEKNKPATWNSNFILTKLCDWKMCYQMIMGRLR